MGRSIKILEMALLLCLVTLLAACDLYEEGWTNQKKATVTQERFFEAVPLADLDAGAVSAVSKYYGRYGDGGLHLSVTYDPHSKTYTAMKAGDDMARLVREFRNTGLHDVKAGVLPVEEAQAKQVLVSFNSFKAQAPEGCGAMPGYARSELEQDQEYALGCTMETLFTRQVARPKDLLGQEQRQALGDGRRSGNTVEVYRSGVPNEPLDGESASEE